MLHNALMPELWRRLRSTCLGIWPGVSRSRRRSPPAPAPSYVRVAEFQRRGAIHLHVIVRLDTAEGECPDVDPTLLHAACRSAAGAVAVRLGWRVLRLGPELTSSPSIGRTTGPGKLAAYVAKYATKSSEDTGGLDRRTRERRGPRSPGGRRDPRRLAVTAWAMADRSTPRPAAPAPPRPRPRLRRALPGQVSLLLDHLRGPPAARAAWLDAHRRPDPLGRSLAYEGHWRAIGIGWANEGERILAEGSRDSFLEERRMANEEVDDAVVT